MSDLKKIIGIADYKVFAGPGWPSYNSLVHGFTATDPKVQQQIDNFIQMMTQTYNEIIITGDLLAEQNQQRQSQTFYDKKYSTANPCQVPWNTLGVNSNGNIYICESPSWVPKFVGNICNATNIYDILNSKTAQQIRQEILQGRYFYCNNKICRFFSKIDPVDYAHALDKDELIPLEFVSTVDTMVTAIPRNLIFDFDYTCNFKCPSCRTELINNNKHHVIRSTNDQIVEKIKQLIIDKIEDQPVNIRWCGGEPFISDVYFELLQYISDSGKTNIRHVIQTNGSYLKSKADLLIKLLPATTELRVSFDAATEQTYNKIRINGVWDTLLANVKWVREYIDTNQLDTNLSADFVVQLDNYHEIPAFVELCGQLGIRQINFQKMWNWGTWEQQTFDEKNIFNPAHPQHPELLNMFKQANRPIPF